MKYLLALILLFSLASSVVPAARAQSIHARPVDCVVVLHGLGLSPRQMLGITQTLSLNGYRVFNIGYPSTHYPVDTLAEKFVFPNIPACPGQMNFVGHSLGGLIIRDILKHHPMANLGRVVMLGSPNEGSELADFLLRTPGFSWLYKRTFGPAGDEMITGPKTFGATLPPVPYEVGVIAGDRHLEPISSNFILSQPNDGIVSAASTKVPGMTDFIELPVTHLSILSDPAVMREILTFLQTGHFLPSAPKTALTGATAAPVASAAAPGLRQ